MGDPGTCETYHVCHVASGIGSVYTHKKKESIPLAMSLSFTRLALLSGAMLESWEEPGGLNIESIRSLVLGC